MKIAVAATGKDGNSEISPRAGRAKFYLLFDGNGNFLEALSNPFSRGGGGAGFGVAKMLADKGVDLVIGCEKGEHMEEALTNRGLKFSRMEGTVKEAVARITAREKE
jgi:predicted Fe-Mo cluster-binding NifX family protein